MVRQEYCFGLAVILAFVGCTLSMALLTDAKLRRSSGIPAVICLFCSLLYLAAFVHFGNRQARRIAAETPAGFYQANPLSPETAKHVERTMVIRPRPIAETMESPASLE